MTLSAFCLVVRLNCKLSLSCTVLTLSKSIDLIWFGVLYSWLMYVCLSIESSDRSECVKETNTPIDAPTHILHQSSLESLRRVIDFDNSDKRMTLADDSKYRCTPNGDIPYLEYVWVSQHYSLSSCPPCWVHPVQLLLQFSGSFSLSSCLHGLELSGNKSSLPTVMSIRCNSPHWHRWNPSSSDDVCGYFHDKVKIVAIKGTIYRYNILDVRTINISFYTFSDW